MDASKKQTTRKTGVAGKKRKKKKPNKDANGATTASKDKDVAKSVKELATFKRSDFAIALTVRKLEERCSSSSSSVENQRPKEKIGRFDESSSDMMSRDTASTISHREGMSVDSDSHSSDDPTPVTHRYQPSIDVDSTTHPQEQIPASTGNGHSRKIEPWAEESLIASGKPAVHRETLRWEGTLSDDEEESIRIEHYKENRRKRYQEALMQKKEHILRNTSRKQLYYTSPTTLTAAVT